MTVTAGVEKYLRTLIADLGAGNRLPSERSAMAELSVCRTTVRIVLTKLTAEGLIRAVHGSGYYKR